MRISLRERLSSKSAAKLSVAWGAGVEVFIIEIQLVTSSVRGDGSVNKKPRAWGSWRLGCPLSIQLQNPVYRRLDTDSCRVELDGIRAPLQGGFRALRIARITLTDLLQKGVHPSTQFFFHQLLIAPPSPFGRVGGQEDFEGRIG